MAFIEYDPNGNVVTNSPRQYDSNGNPLPIFGPVTDDETTFWFFAAPIPYNITFVDERGAANTNATTYTVEDCYNFAPPAEVEGWEFLGWDVPGVDHQTGDITVTAQWRRSNRQVTFDVGAHGSRTGGGELSQTVAWGEAAVPPEIEADIDWVFAGWDTDISRVTESMTVTALYERPPLPFAKAAGYGGAWTSGGDAEWFTEWTEEAHDGTNHLHSGAIGDGQVSWVETVVTNAGVLSFWWRASSESYRGVAYDKLVFTVDGAVPESVPPIGGETDWSNVVCVVEGSGPHVLRWTYQKDASDFGGEDCAWLDDVQYLHQVRVVFAVGGATGGASPEAMTVGEGFEIALPGQGALAWPKHRFLGWRVDEEVLAAGTTYVLGYDDVLFTAVWEEKRVAEPTITVAAWYDTERTTVSMACVTPGAVIHYTLDGSAPTAASPVYGGSFQLAGSATIQAVAMRDDWFDSEVVSAVSVRAPWTPDECLDATGLVFRTGGSAAWARDRTMAHDGDTSMRSGAIGDEQISWIETAVTGSGTLAFWWKASSESYKERIYDYARFSVDGEELMALGGITDWTNAVVEVSGSGEHTLRWTYLKDEQDAVGEDCAWLDEVTWTPDPDPLPAIASDGEVASVLSGATDAALAANIATKAEYDAFREWAQMVKGADGTAAGKQAVKESGLAWLSFALASDTLIAEDIESDDVYITGFSIDHGAESTGGQMQFSFEVAIDGVEIGSSGAIGLASLKENLKKAIGIEGATRLDGEFSSANIELTFDTLVDGKARFTATPPPDAGTSFFIRAKVQ